MKAKIDALKKEMAWGHVRTKEEVGVAGYDYLHLIYSMITGIGEESRRRCQAGTPSSQIAGRA